jgi:SAM-dependent methyltransferase
MNGPSQLVESPPPPLACPRTGAPLSPEAGALRAPGGASYPVVAGIPRFLRFEPQEDGPTAARLAELNRLAHQQGWRAALEEVYRDDPAMVRYVTAGGRGSFLDLVPLSGEHDVLEIGASLGQLTVPLARRARSVCALEVVPGQAEFAAERCRQVGLDNVAVAVGGDDCRLPYRGASFDLVVLNLVLEWCASRCLDEPFVEVQRRLLGEMARVLRPGGALWLSTKNRFALRLLLGRRDEHLHDLPFGSALPRWLGAALLRRRGHRRAGGLLHSHAALSAMLRQAGFEGLRSFWAAPEMRHPDRFVPTDAASVRAARREGGLVQGELRSTRALMPLVPAALVKHLTPGLAFLATRRR